MPLAPKNFLVISLNGGNGHLFAHRGLDCSITLRERLVDATLFSAQDSRNIAAALNRDHPTVVRDAEDYLAEVTSRAAEIASMLKLLPADPSRLTLDR